MPEPKNPPSPTSKLINDAAPAPAPGPAEKPPEEGAPKLAQPGDPGGDLSQGFIVLRLSPEGTQTGPERRKAGTTRGPNATVPLKRMNLLRTSPDDQVMRAVAAYTHLPLDEFSDCVVLRSDNPNHAIEVHRPRPGEDAPRLAHTKDSIRNYHTQSGS